MKKLLCIGILFGASYGVDSLCMQRQIEHKREKVQNAPVGNKEQEEHVRSQVMNGLARFDVQEQSETMEWFSLRMIKQERALTEQEQARLAVLIEREVRRQAKKGISNDY